MVTPHEAEINLDAYARLAVGLARADSKRDAFLASHGLDESRWQAIDDLWQTRLSDALDANAGDETLVPPLVDAYARATERAQSGQAQVMAFERFVEATRAARAGGALAGVTLDDYLRANRHYTKLMMQDDALAERFRRAL